MAHKKGVGSTDNGRDSKPKYLGVKLFGGQKTIAGNIIVRQRGTRFHAGENTYLGKDHTIHAYIDGYVKFTKGRKDRTTVSVLPFNQVAETVAPKSVAKAAVKMAAPKTAPVAPKVEPKAEPKIEAPLQVAETIAPVVAAEPVVEAVAEAVAAPKTAPKGKGPKQDDLKIVEGIGPKIEQLLHEGGIKTWAELAAAPIDRLKEILNAAGPRFQMHDPSTWPAQSKFADEGRFDELQEYQDMLIGGRDKSE